MHQVMLVDDYEIFRKQLKRHEYWQNQSKFVLVSEADNGLDALTALRKKAVDILVTDIKMPKLNGLELLERVRDEGLCKCVILLSEYADFEYARKGIVLGAFDYIVKPVKDDSFFDVLNRAADYITKSSKAEDETFYERTAVVNCILNGSDNFEKAIASLSQKCDDSVHHDFIKYGVLLAESERKIYEAVSAKMEWLPLLISSIDHICNKIIQSDNMFTISAIFEEFLREMYASVKTYYPPKMSALSVKVVDYVLEHPFEKLTLTATAENCFVSKAYLSHSFKLDMGKSFVEYVSCLKMQIIKKLLLETDMSMAEIAEKLNYEDSKYMGRLFKNIFGMTPTDYKKCRTPAVHKKPY
ncbi:response regulator [Ethanoligenens sp.]|uniref:response regulator transcription factor n=1 Tax=Ethanoligenens sp. TaxID=2099655 RepID=UPI0039EA241C